MSIWLQKSALVQPRTSFLKFADAYMHHPPPAISSALDHADEGLDAHHRAREVAAFALDAFGERATELAAAADDSRVEDLVEQDADALGADLDARIAEATSGGVPVREQLVDGACADGRC